MIHGFVMCVVRFCHQKITQCFLVPTTNCCIERKAVGASTQIYRRHPPGLNLDEIRGVLIAEKYTEG